MLSPRSYEIEKKKLMEEKKKSKPKMKSLVYVARMMELSNKFKTWRDANEQIPEKPELVRQNGYSK